jgi:hypothetical protein
VISASIRPPNAITDFLYRALAGGALGVEELEIKARATGLLGVSKFSMRKRSRRPRRRLVYDPFGLGSEAAVSGLGLCRHKLRLKSTG